MADHLKNPPLANSYGRYTSRMVPGTVSFGDADIIIVPYMVNHRECVLHLSTVTDMTISVSISSIKSLNGDVGAPAVVWVPLSGIALRTVINGPITGIKIANGAGIGDMTYEALIG